MNIDKSVLIKLNDWNELKEFAQTICKFESDINIYHDSNYWDAKSIMALMALDISKSRYVEIVSNSVEEINSFKEQMEKFRANE